MLPLWLLTLLVLVFAAPLVFNDAPFDIVDTVLTALLVAAAFAATIVGYWPHDR